MVMRETAGPFGIDPRIPYPRSTWEMERPPVDPVLDDTNFEGPEAIKAPGRLRTIRPLEPTRAIHPLEPVSVIPSSTVGRMLAENCHIDHVNFFLAVTLRNGQQAYFSGPQALSDLETREIFDMRGFQHYQGLRGPEFVRYSRRRSRDRELRLRPRRQRDDPTPVSIVMVPLMIGDADAVWNLYKQRFKDCQQIACKNIAKTFIKTIAPKKQTHHPYTRGESSAPDWWPKTETELGKPARHKEPDHQGKEERIHVLCHILRLVVEPNATQHKDIRPLNITVSTLEKAAMDSLAPWFRAKTENEKKREFLLEIFKVAKNEARYKRNECDANTAVYVRPVDPSKREPSPEEEEDESGQVVEEMDVEENISPISPHLAPTRSPQNHSPTGSAQDRESMNDLPVRTSQYMPAIMPGGLSTEQTQYNVHIHMQDSLPSIHDNSRRSPIYDSPTEFSPPPPPSQGMYHSTGWQQHTTTAPTSPAAYAFPPLHQQHPPPLPPPPHPSATFGPPQSMNLAHHHQGQGYMTRMSSYDGMPPQTPGLYPGSPASSVVMSPAVTQAAQPQGYSSYHHHHMSSPGSGRYSSRHGDDMTPRRPLP